MSGKFRHTIYDPILIILQIVTLTSLFYFSLTVLIYFIDLVFDFDVNISQLFNYKLIGLNNGYNFSITSAFLLNSVVGSFYLWVLVSRAKPCLDFSATIYIIHLVLCWIYNGFFPNTFSWWILQLICMSIMCITAEYMCTSFELRPISLKQKEKEEEELLEREAA